MTQPPKPASPAPGEPILHRYDPRQPVTLPIPTVPAKPGAALEAGTPSTVPDNEDGQPPQASTSPTTPAKPVEIGGPSGPEPTRYGDWERNGRVSDF